MATETLVPNGDDSGWPTGAFSDINEDFGSPDASIMRTTDAELDDVLILDFGDSAVLDADTVTNITIDLRALCSGSGGKDDYLVELLIGGVSQGTSVTHSGVGQSFVTLSSNDVGWNVDRSASDMDGLQVRITSAQRGMGSSGNWDLDTVRVVVTYTEDSPTTDAVGTITITGDLVALGEHSGVTATSLSSGDLAAIGEHTGVTGTSTATGDLSAIGEHSGVTASITMTGDLAAIGTPIVAITDASSGIAFGSAGHRQVVLPPQSFIHEAVLEEASFTTAVGTITFSVSLDSVAEHSGITATITITGDCVSRGTTNVRGTITILGVGISEGTHNAFGVISFIGELIAGGGSTLVFATITMTGDLASVGISLGLAQGTSTFTGDLAAIGIDLTSETKFAAGTITVTGDLDSVGTTLAKATSTITGELAAIGGAFEFAAGTSTITGDLDAVGTTNARGTITILGVGIAEATHLAVGTITLTGDLVATGISLVTAVGTITITGELAGVGISRQSAVGTITFIFDGAASGTHLAGGTSIFSGQVVAVGTDISGEDIPPGQSIFQREVSLPNDQSVIPVGIQAFPGPPATKGKIQFSGSLRAVTGNIQVTGTITVTGSLSSLAPHDLFNIASISIFVDEVPIAPAFVWLHGGPPPVNNALGSISIFGNLSVADDITQFAFGTITILGAVTSDSEGIVNAFGTITVTGDLAAIGGKTLVTVTATITVFGTADAVSGQIQVSVTILVSGRLDSIGTNLDTPSLASGTITALLKLEAIPSIFCPINASGTINLLFDLTAFEDVTDDIVPVSASIQVSGSLQSSLYHYAAGGNLLAKGTITFIGSLGTYFREVTCITPTATITFSGAIISAGLTNANLLSKSASITMFASLGVSAIYAPESQISVAGELTALGRNLAFGILAMMPDAANLTTYGQIGPGTIDGQKKSLIREDYGSLELYNNGQGSFYSIGSSGSLKEVFGLINVVLNLNSKGSKDQTVYRSGSINQIGSLSAIGNHLLVSGSINVKGNMSGGGGTQFASATIVVSAGVTSVGSIISVWTLSDILIKDFDPTSLEDVESSWRLDPDGYIYIKRLNEVGDIWVKTLELTDWIIPHEASQNPGPPPAIKVRATKLSGTDPTGPRALDVWHSTDLTIEWLLEVTPNGGFRSCDLLIELSHDDGITIETSATITLTARSFSPGGDR